MKVLVIGSGGREHALAWKLARSPRVQTVFVAPGNAGTAAEPSVKNVAITDLDKLADFAVHEKVALTVVGPEVSLAAGAVDIFRAKGLRIFGPTKAAAQLESSKAFAKSFMARHAIPTAGYVVFEDAATAKAHIDAAPLPIVVKADGLAAGKGVVVASTRAEAHAAVDAMLGNARAGSGNRVVVEEFLEGEEASFMVLCDGRSVLPLATSQDHKRIGDGDTGPNTGGMGAYSPAPVVTPNVHARAMQEIVVPTIEGMAADGVPFSGFLYVGLMIDAQGVPKTVEFNCRLGDPETQPILMRLKSDLFDVLMHATANDPSLPLGDLELQWDRRVALGVVMAASGYPGEPQKGDPIAGLPADSEDVKVFHAATAAGDGMPVTSGGRVLCVTALGDSTRLAQQRAYEIVRGISFAGAQYRRDIGTEGTEALSAELVRTYLLGLQDRIVAAMEKEGGDAFLTDHWQREPGGKLEGEGISRLVEGGGLLERAGCSFSHVKGQALPASATQHRGAELAGAPFEAMGVSLVFHPRNPYVPTVHMNVRMLQATPLHGAPSVWFGGGMDLTPYYGFDEDAHHFHATNRDALAPFGAEAYPRFKRWCDEYFFLKHRNEPRGIGGVFFDDVSEGGFAPSFALMQAVGDSFLQAYLPILQRRRDMPYGERERAFQTYRRGRYVEFNLVFDRGTLFGLQSGGRTESILMSMPPVVTWRYDWKPEPGTPEARLYSDFLRPRDWADWTAA